MNGDYTPLFGNKGSVPFFRQITRIMNDGKCCNARPDPVADLLVGDNPKWRKKTKSWKYLKATSNICKPILW
jgi:hypothetical protein